MKNVDTIDKNMNKQEDIKTLASEIRRLNKRVKQLEEAGQNVGIRRFFSSSKIKRQRNRISIY